MIPEERYKVLVEYLHMKMLEKDWHGVSDAAMDLREMEARWPELRQLAVKVQKDD